MIINLLIVILIFVFVFNLLLLSRQCLVSRLFVAFFYFLIIGGAGCTSSIIEFFQYFQTLIQHFRKINSWINERKMDWVKKNGLQLVIFVTLVYLLFEVHTLKNSVTASSHESEMTNVKLDYVVSDINTKVFKQPEQNN